MTEISRRRVVAASAAAMLLALHGMTGCASSPPPAPGAQASAWITAEEAKLPEAGVLRRALPSDGPIIRMIKPESQGTTHSPIDIEIRFEPRDESEIVLDSLKVEYMKFFAIDITDRIRPFATPEGIKGSGIEFPEGKHRVRVSIRDSLDRLTAAEFEIRVDEA